MSEKSCPATAHADVKCPFEGVYENSETPVRIGPKRVYEMGRITQNSGACDQFYGRKGADSPEF
jgi:hypothetical protein